jgi:hypothetical protein
MIRLGSLAGYSFEGPYTLGGWNPIDSPGVFAIMYKPETEKDTYAVVYMGHTDNFKEEGFPFKHAAAPCWTERAGSQWKLFIAFFIPPGGATRSIRAGIAQELNAVYEPICNEDQYVQHWEPEWIGDYESNLTKKLMLSTDADVHKQSADPAGRREEGR